jgi:SAM-dependent methyltransferase
VRPPGLLRRWFQWWSIEVRTTYDTVRYYGSAFSQTHPIRLATVASLFGIDPAPPDRCRVLEIGAGDGANIIPMAAHFTESQFVGIDLAESAVEIGNEVIRTLSLKNIELRAMDLLDATADLGTFDYIIAHGVFAWVPPNVQDKLLSITGETLAPNGVAYVSYNSYPGAHLRTIVRDMMRYYLDDGKPHADAVAESIPFLKFIGEEFSGGDDKKAAIIGEITDTLERPAYVVYHDELTEAYTPVYFHDFVNRAAACGLQFLGEAHLEYLRLGRFTPEVSEKIDRLCGTDRIRREQMWDFLKLRKFRSTLLVRSEVQLNENAATERIPMMYVASLAEIVGSDAAEPQAVEFKGPHGASLKTAHPLVKATMACVIERWPEPIPFATVLRSVEQRTGSQVDPGELANILLAATHAGLMYLEAFPFQCVREPGPRPRVSAIARLQAERGWPITTQRHTALDATGDIGRFLVTLLDGTRGRKELLSDMKAAIETDAPDEAFEQMLDENLRKLATTGLLIE